MCEQVSADPAIQVQCATSTVPYSCNHTSRESNGPMSGVKIQTFRPNPGHHTLRWTLVHLKDPTPLRQRTGVVYQIPCSNCEKVYIGQTGRTLDHRLKEHRRALISGNVQQSAVAEHATNEMHDIDWEKAEVVDCHPHYHQRFALEAWHIRTEPHRNEQGHRPTTNGLQSINPPSTLALLRTCCCLHIILHFLPLFFACLLSHITF